LLIIADTDKETLMNPVRLFSLQAQKTASLEAIGGITEIDQSTAAAMCAGMPEKWYKAARLKWSADHSNNHWLEIRLMVFASGIAGREKWRIIPGRLRSMSRLAIEEMQYPEKLNRQEAWRYKAGSIGVGSSQWFKTWVGRYEAIYQELNDWANRAYSYVEDKQKLTNTE